ncbi:uncharacterized protein LOC108674159, partial [Hyalella azteca]|uniref:Uncharacterized protein LOC108674159 n=1 Tax=Hyalella azteca TaxID=294128 RepID=A0A8B7NUY8_HYAAZ
MRNTSFHAILNSDDFWNTPYLFTQLSDLLRLAVVYHSGGLYTDTDILALRPFKNLAKNYFHALDNDANIPSNALFHFERHHPTPKNFLEFLADTFSPLISRLWYGTLGPFGLMGFFRSNGCAFRILTPQNAPAYHPDPTEPIGIRMSPLNYSAVNDGAFNGTHCSAETSGRNMETSNYHDVEEEDRALARAFSSDNFFSHEVQSMTGRRLALFMLLFTLILWCAYTIGRGVNSVMG